MKLYPAIISTYRDSNSELKSPDDYIRIRIPQFHGVKDDTNVSNGVKFCEDSSLPFASIQRDFSNKDFSASSFNDGDIVYVMLENDDINTPIITGYASRFAFTLDPVVAAANKFGEGYSAIGFFPDGTSAFENFDAADAIVAVAKRQAELKIHDDGNNRVLYNDAYWGYGTCGPNYPWCCAFVWWVFNNTVVDGESCAKYFYGGNKTAGCTTLMKYYKSKNQFISSGFKKGDLVFFNWKNPKNFSVAEHIGIVIEDQSSLTSDVITIEGNTSGSGSQANGGHVMQKTRKMSCIIGGARLSLPKANSPITGTNEEQVFKFLTTVLSFDGKKFNNAAACGILANIQKESSFNPTTSGDNGTSYGLCQWHDTKPNKGRMTNMKNFCKNNNYSYSTITGQMMYLQKELYDSYNKDVLQPILRVNNNESGAMEAAKIWCKKFEIPENKEQIAIERAEYAKIFWAKYG